MGVILDIEWTQSKKSRLTQLSAIHISSDWGRMDRLDMVIRQPRGTVSKWSEMPFHGHISAEYQSGETEKKAILRLVNWVKPWEDVYVWDANSSTQIEEKYKKYFSDQCPLHFLSLRDCVMSAIKKDGFGSMTIYGIAEAYRFNIPKIEHCSRVDVDILQAIMSRLKIDQSVLPEYQSAKKTFSAVKGKAEKERVLPPEAKLYNGAVIGTIHSHSKIVHMPHCRYVKGTPSQNRISFSTLSAARNAGYRLCNCCPSVVRKFRTEREKIFSFAESQNLNIRLHDGFVEVSSPVDMWRITTAQSKKKPLILYHKNKKWPISSLAELGEVAGYHEQPIRENTIVAYLKYIVRHDKFREENPYVERIKIPCAEKSERKKHVYTTKRQRVVLGERTVFRLQSLLDELKEEGAG